MVDGDPSMWWVGAFADELCRKRTNEPTHVRNERTHVRQSTLESVTHVVYCSHPSYLTSRRHHTTKVETHENTHEHTRTTFINVSRADTTSAWAYSSSFGGGGPHGCIIFCVQRSKLEVRSVDVVVSVQGD